MPLRKARPAIFTKHRQPKPCVACGRNTTGPVGVISDVMLCPACHEAAGLTNEHWDTGGAHDGRAPVSACPECRQRGGA